jgi:hypothetical protein
MSSVFLIILSRPLTYMVTMPHILNHTLVLRERKDLEFFRTFVPDCFDEHTVLHVTFDRKGIRGSVAIEPAGDANSTAVECEGVVTEMPSADQLLLQFNVTGLRHIRDYQARESRQ